MKKLLFCAACLLAVALFVVFAITNQQIVQGSADFQVEKTPAEKTFALAPPPILLQPVASGLSRPLYVTNTGDTRLFIVQQNGQVLISQDGSVLPTPFLDIVSLVNCCGERGLIGFAFHPNYPATNFIFAHFTSNGTPLPDGTPAASGDNVIVRFTASGNVANPASGKTLLVMPQPFSNHNGGMIEFGPDNFLYIGKGDGGSGNDPGNRAQNINLLLGKILRIDVDQNVNTPPYYGIPAGNPFLGTAGADEIFLIGLRNPFRFSFDRLNGDLWIGDVGQNAREEIDHLPINAAAPGRNLGWRIYEGTLCTNLDPCVFPVNYLPPVAEYARAGGRCSITGGYVYRGTQIPALVGSYVYADYCSGEIFRLTQGTIQEVMLDTTNFITSFGEDAAGELYITTGSGQVLRIAPAAPVATSIISGRITNAQGQGIGTTVLLTLSGGNLTEPLQARATPAGFFRFEAPAGQTYTVTPVPDGRTFTPVNRQVTLSTENVFGIDFITQ